MHKIKSIQVFVLIFIYVAFLAGVNHLFSVDDPKYHYFFAPDTLDYYKEWIRTAEGSKGFRKFDFDLLDSKTWTIGTLYQYLGSLIFSMQRALGLSYSTIPLLFIQVYFTSFSLYVYFDVLRNKYTLNSLKSPFIFLVLFGFHSFFAGVLVRDSLVASLILTIFSVYTYTKFKFRLAVQCTLVFLLFTLRPSHGIIMLIFLIVSGSKINRLIYFIYLPLIFTFFYLPDLKILTDRIGVYFELQKRLVLNGGLISIVYSNTPDVLFPIVNTVFAQFNPFGLWQLYYVPEKYDYYISRYQIGSFIYNVGFFWWFWYIVKFLVTRKVWNREFLITVIGIVFISFISNDIRRIYCFFPILIYYWSPVITKRVNMAAYIFLYFTLSLIPILI